LALIFCFFYLYPSCLVVVRVFIIIVWANLIFSRPGPIRFMSERLLTFLSSITIVVLDILDRIKVFDMRSCILVAIEELKSLLTIAGCVLLNIAMMLHI
jgi:hypothetical protein